MKTQFFATVLFSLALVAGTNSISAQGNMMKKDKMNKKTVMVGGAAMYANKNIIENAVNSKDHTTLVAAVKAGELVETLQSDGPFAVFAPINSAFDKLPKGTVETLLKQKTNQNYNLS